MEIKIEHENTFQTIFSSIVHIGVGPSQPTVFTNKHDEKSVISCLRSVFLRAKKGRSELLKQQSIPISTSSLPTPKPEFGLRGG